ncbi:hypothetical protein ACFLV6_03980 [Chloroflexota bacterium]
MEEVAVGLQHEWESYEIDWQAIGDEDAKIWVQKAFPNKSAFYHR